MIFWRGNATALNDVYTCFLSIFFPYLNGANLRISTVLLQSYNYIRIANLPNFKMVSLRTSLHILCLVATLSSTEALKCLHCTSALTKSTKMVCTFWINIILASSILGAVSKGGECSGIMNQMAAWCPRTRPCCMSMLCKY